MSRTEEFTVENHVGRLIEARVHHLSTLRDADVYSEDLAREVAKVPAELTPVLCADHRFAPVYPQPVTDRLVELFQHMNARLERVAILVSPEAATLYMQLNRIVRAANNKARRIFRDVPPALEHLALGLDAQELARAEVFLRDAP